MPIPRGRPENVTAGKLNFTSPEKIIETAEHDGYPMRFEESHAWKDAVEKDLAVSGLLLTEGQYQKLT